MREILLRGKRKENGQWVEGYFVHCKSTYDDESGRTAEMIPHNADRICKGEYSPYDVHEVIFETVGQFTGLYDNTKWEDLTDSEKSDFYHQHYIGEDGMSVRFQRIDDVKHLWKGKKIFEGDFCRVCLDPEICTAHIQYDERTASFNMRYNAYQCNTFLDMRLAENRVGDRVWIKVIGNIHDNPELLEVGNV